MMIEPQSTIELRRSWWGVSDCKNYKDFRKPRCIDCYLPRLVVYHFRKPTDDDENRIVTGALPTMSRYREQLQVSIVFPGNEFSSFLDAKVTSQLNSDDLRNVGQALVMHNSLNILPAIKLILD